MIYFLMLILIVDVLLVLVLCHNRGCTRLCEFFSCCVQDVSFFAFVVQPSVQQLETVHPICHGVVNSDDHTRPRPSSIPRFRPRTLVPTFQLCTDHNSCSYFSRRITSLSLRSTPVLNKKYLVLVRVRE